MATKKEDVITAILKRLKKSSISPEEFNEMVRRLRKLQKSGS